MMMLFKVYNITKKFKMQAVVCILFLVVFDLFALENPHEIYKNNKGLILNKKYMILNGFCFSVGSCYPKTKSTLSRYGAQKKSSFLATINFSKRILDKIKWPNSINKNLQRKIFETYTNIVGVNIYLTKLQTIDQGKIGNDFYTVKAVPASNIESPNISYKDIYNTLCKAFENKDKRLNYSAYLEICPDNQIQQVINDLAMFSNYGKNTKAVMELHKVSSLPESDSFKKITLESLKKFKVNELFTVLEVMPYYPVICLEIGKRLYAQGMVRNAEIFYLAGTKWPVDIKMNKLCREKITFPYFKSKACNPMSEEWLCLIKQIESKKAELENGWTPTSELIIKCLGTIPVLNGTVTKSYYKGMEQYNNNNLAEALNLFLEELNNNISSDNCNMIGNCLYYLNHKEVALPFFMQSLEMNPDNIDSLIHTAFIFEYLGHLNKAKKYAVKVKESGNIPEWSKEQINKIISR